MKQTLVSGIKPTGRPHIGNYFGAMKQFVELQHEYDSYIFIAEYHALTTLQNKEELSSNILDILIDYLAIGLDPKHVTLYRQSQVPEVTELAWILECLVTVPYLQRAHAYKDATDKGREPNAGTFNYPMLMAADILLPGADIVPVGKDQKQHVEYARDAAQKFNNTFGETFKLPKEHILETTEIVPGIDGQKMSKSYNNYIPLFAEYEDIKKLVMSIVTDSKAPEEPKNPEEDNVFALHKLFTPGPQLDEIREGYEKGGLSYGESKTTLLENIEQFIAPLREKRQEIAKDTEYVFGVLEEGGRRAHEKIGGKMAEVRDKVGLVLY